MEDSLVQWSLGSVLPVYTFVFRHPCFHYVGQRQHRTPRGHGGNIDNWRSGAGMAMYYAEVVGGAVFRRLRPSI